MGNPAIFPLIYDCDSRDVVIVHINPLERPRLPTTASEIMNRINEISFNSSLMREMRAIAFVTKLIDDGKISDNSLKRMLIHGIEAADVMAEAERPQQAQRRLGQPDLPDGIGPRARQHLARDEFRPARKGIDRRHSRGIPLIAPLRADPGRGVSGAGRARPEGGRYGAGDPETERRIGEDRRPAAAGSKG
jgi:hypothetical protein